MRSDGSLNCKISKAARVFWFFHRYIPTLLELDSEFMSIPLPYAKAPRPIRSRPRPLPDSMACMARYRRIDSGISLQSSPLSMLFLARFFILALLIECVSALP